MLKALASNYELVVAILVFVIGFCMLLFEFSNFCSEFFNRCHLYLLT